MKTAIEEEASLRQLVYDILAKHDACVSCYTGHAGDCTIYACLSNGRPEDGICTCGYGWQQMRKGNMDCMYSEERKNHRSVNTEADFMLPVVEAAVAMMNGGGLDNAACTACRTDRELKAAIALKAAIEAYVNNATAGWPVIVTPGLRSLYNDAKRKEAGEKPSEPKVHFNYGIWTCIKCGMPQTAKAIGFSEGICGNCQMFGFNIKLTPQLRSLIDAAKAFSESYE